MGITKGQWRNVCLNLLGLRSEDNGAVIKSAASYAMDCGKEWNNNKEPPENWDSLLKGTIERMQGFGGYEKRFLLVVNLSTGALPPEYSGCFPKCSAKSSTVYAATPLNDTVDHLIEWVMQEISIERM